VPEGHAENVCVLLVRVEVGPRTRFGGVYLRPELVVVVGNLFVVILAHRSFGDFAIERRLHAGTTQR